MVSWAVAGLLTLLIVQRLAELGIANRNRAWALALGAREHGAGHYPLFFVLHIGWLVGWVIEALLRGPALSGLWWLWLGLFIAAQGLRYWSIASLGKYWNTRILVVPGNQPISRGPYRFIRHPNYLAVIIELLSVPLIFGAWVTALVASVLNAILLLGIRIPTENKALKQYNAQQHNAMRQQTPEGDKPRDDKSTDF